MGARGPSRKLCGQRSARRFVPIWIRVAPSQTQRVSTTLHFAVLFFFSLCSCSLASWPI